MDSPIWVALIILAAIGLIIGFDNKKNRTKSQIVKALLDLPKYSFPLGVVTQFKMQYPKLSDKEISLIQTGLRDFFALIILNPTKKIAMPSRLVDDLWHIFLEHDSYQDFCQTFVGKPIKHIESPESPKGFDKAQPIRKISSDVHSTFKLLNKSNNTFYYTFAMVDDKFPLLFMADYLLKADFGYFYDPTSFSMLSSHVASRSTSTQRSSSTSSCSGCSYIGCGGGCSCSSSGGDCGSSCGGGCGGGCGGD